MATAEAGLTLTEFQKQIAERGQWLPIDPPDDGTATLGGVVAAGLNGPHAAGFGALRSFVIGLRAVLANGRSIKAGGNVVKNVAGYDLCKLFTGSWGTLGLITEITFKLRPLPAETRSIIAAGPQAKLIEHGRAIASQFSTAAVELISRGLAEDLNIARKAGQCALFVRFAGSTRAIVTQTAQTLKLLRDAGLSCETTDDDAELWQRLSASSCQPIHDLAWRGAVRPTDLAAFLEEISASEDDEAAQAGLRWHAGLGDGRVRAFGRAAVYSAETLRALERLRERAEAVAASLVIEKAPVVIKNQLDSWGNLSSAAALMKRVKNELDPQNVLSPGRMFA